MRNMVFHNLRIVVLGLAVLALGACAGTPMKGYTGSVLSADQTALVRIQFNTDLVAYDGTRVSDLSITVLPGEHTIELKPRESYEYQQQGPYFFYSLGTGSVAFTAEAGHKYLAYVNIATAPSTEDKLGTYTWAGYIDDETTHKRVAGTERLPLGVRPIPR
jgi:hypothetical protein